MNVGLLPALRKNTALRIYYNKRFTAHRTKPDRLRADSRSVHARRERFLFYHFLSENKAQVPISGSPVARPAVSLSSMGDDGFPASPSTVRSFFMFFFTGRYLQEAQHWPTGEAVHIKEVECRAMGAKACVWEINK